MGYGPTILGVAVTNRPNVRLKKHKIRKLDDGSYLVPFLVEGKYRYARDGRILNFTKKKMEKMLSNWENQVFDGDVTVDARHMPQLGALIFLEKDKGGSIKLSDDNGTYVLSGHGIPVSDEAEKVLAGYSMASVEYHPDYSSLKMMGTDDDLQQLIHELSADGQSQFLEFIEENDNMDKVKELEGQVLSLTGERDGLAEKITSLQEAVDTLKASLGEKDETIKELEGKVPEVEPEVPEAVRVRLEALEAANARLKERNHLAIIDAKMVALSQPKDGKMYPAKFLNLVRAVLMGEFSDGDETITMEATDPATYVNKAIDAIVASVDRSVPVEPKSEGDDTKRLGENKQGDQSDETLDKTAKEMWEVS